MKKLTTILIVILYIILGRYLIILDYNNFLVKFILTVYSAGFVIFFTYGVYKLLTIDEK